ncbi:MAG: hypothetical protein M1836_003748 [Candelina mexicana]|nr:MAG: hypothetical protein M1836_003748 [Candelina mexicana]
MSPVTVPSQPAPASSTLASTCPHCGASIEHARTDVNEDAQRRIAELESQVKILTGKATAAVDKLADYEDQLHALKPAPSPSSSSSPPHRPTLQTSTSETSLPKTESRSPSTEHTRPSTAHPTATATAAPTPIRTSLLPTASNRISSFLSRKPTPTPSATPTTTTHPSPPATPLPPDLQSQLAHERQLRQAAETRLSQLNSEIEDLSASLFSEANEMVAKERRIRVDLEKRIEVLEGREGDRGRRLERLERLEGRVGRVERVRGLLGEK